MKSWKTTLGGILLAAGQFLGPSLPPEYSWITSALTGLGGLLVGLSARDNKVTSEQAKAKY